MSPSRFIASFDTEDDGAGNPYLFGIVHGKGSYVCETRERCLDYISTLAKDLKLADSVLELWATNLEYDLVNLFGPERVKELNLIFGKSYLVGASWKGHNVDFRDTVRHVPLSVKELGPLVGLEKLEAKNKADRDSRYMIRDASITRKTALWLDEVYKSFGMAPKLTLASSALHIWKDKYWKREVILPADEIVRNAKHAYYGGRTEAFAIGEYKDVTAIDVASMFPWAMLADKFPIPWGDFQRYAPGDKISPYGFYRASISADLQYPFLPVRTLQGTQYPNGKWEGWYTGHEILYAETKGYAIKASEGYTFTAFADPFTEYVNTFFKLKGAEKGAARLAYKLLLNALYGKFGQTGERIICTPLEQFVRLKSAPLDYRVWNGLALYSKEGRPPPWGNNVWPALITSRARIRLAGEMERIRNNAGIPLYCDTDSIIYTGAKGIFYPAKAAKAGEFELRGEYASIYIAGKKEYGLCDREGAWEIHVKGVPLSARKEYLFNGVATYEKPTRLREAARGKKQANVWETKHKQRKVSYADRAIRADGTLKPLILGDKKKPKRKGK